MLSKVKKQYGFSKNIIVPAFNLFSASLRRTLVLKQLWHHFLYLITFYSTVINVHRLKY